MTTVYPLDSDFILFRGKRRPKLYRIPNLNFDPRPTHDAGMPEHIEKLVERATTTAKLEESIKNMKGQIIPRTVAPDLAGRAMVTAAPRLHARINFGGIVDKVTGAVTDVGSKVSDKGSSVVSKATEQGSSVVSKVSSKASSVGSVVSEKGSSIVSKVSSKASSALSVALNAIKGWIQDEFGLSDHYTWYGHNVCTGAYMKGDLTQFDIDKTSCTDPRLWSWSSQLHARICTN